MRVKPKTVCDENILNEIITFLNGCDFLIDDIYRAGFLEFKNYLIKYYFSPGSPFNPGNFDYYNSILMEGYMTTSTNCLESLNRQLKDLSGSGYLSFNRTCGIIKEFKVHFIQMHEEKIVNDQMNKRKKRALDRENLLKDILDNFYDSPYEKQLSSTISTAYEIGNISRILNISSAAFTSNISPVITTEEELADITLNL